MSKYLITLRSTPCSVDFSGKVYVGTPIIKTILIDEHPAKYLAQSRKEHDRVLNQRRVNTRADQEDVLWCIAVPEGTLQSEEEIYLL